MERPELRIISDEEFEQAARIMKSRNTVYSGKHKRQSNRYLFSTLIKCKDCGWSYRRGVRKYKNTYIKWVCSGHNGRGADSCPNSVVLDEADLIRQIDSYLLNMLKNETQLEKDIKNSFIKKYKSNNENEKYREELETKRQKYQCTRQKYMDMYADDLISREELREAIGDMKDKVAAIERELDFVNQNLENNDSLDNILEKNIREIKTVMSVRDMNNVQLKNIIDRIEVDHEGNIDVYVKSLDK